MVDGKIEKRKTRTKLTFLFRDLEACNQFGLFFALGKKDTKKGLLNRFGFYVKKADRMVLRLSHILIIAA